MKVNPSPWIICLQFLNKINKKVRWIWWKILTQCRGCLQRICTMFVRRVKNNQIPNKILHHNSTQCNLYLPRKIPLNKWTSQRLETKTRKESSTQCKAYSKHKICNICLSKFNKTKMWKILIWATSTQCSRCSQQ